MFNGFNASQAKDFTDVWLPAWTGNNPELLASFYTDDAFYSDPIIRNGIRGGDQLLAYFSKLLARNPDWVWTHERSTPIENGFNNYWKAAIPIGATVVVCLGLCTVQLRNNLIYRNEVFFDRSELLTIIEGRT